MICLRLTNQVSQVMKLSVLIVGKPEGDVGDCLRPVPSCLWTQK